LYLRPWVLLRQNPVSDLAALMVLEERGAEVSFRRSTGGEGGAGLRDASRLILFNVAILILAAEVK